MGDAIAERMRDLRLTKAELIRRSGISDKSLSAYLDGAPIRRDDKKWALLDALGWTGDSIDLIHQGFPPMVATDYDALVRAPSLAERLDDIAAQLDDVYQYLEVLAAAAERTEESLDYVQADVEAAAHGQVQVTDVSLGEILEELRPLLERRRARVQVVGTGSVGANVVGAVRALGGDADAEDLPMAADTEGEVVEESVVRDAAETARRAGRSTRRRVGSFDPDEEGQP